LPYSELKAPKEPSELKRDEENGWVLEDGNRIVTFKVKTFQAFSDRVNELFGAKVGSVVLYQTGSAIGHAAMKYSKDRIRSEDEIGKVLDQVLNLRGWGRCVELTSRAMGSKKVYVFKTRGSPFSHERTSTEPTCHMIRGIVSGWSEGYFDGKVTASVERECASMGRPLCVFEVILEK
jgi:predicted hydrocarbon binding protein